MKRRNWISMGKLVFAVAGLSLGALWVVRQSLKHFHEQKLRKKLLPDRDDRNMTHKHISRLKLIARIELCCDEEIQLEVEKKPPERLEGYFSRRPELANVRPFLESHGLPYCRKYVPMFVYAKGESSSGDDARFGSYGYPFELDPIKVLPDIELGCCEDVQKAACHNWPIGCFGDLRHLDVKMKEEQLLLMVKLSRNNKYRYAEARLHRPLRLSDLL
jgi:hypothetical protein